MKVAGDDELTGTLEVVEPARLFQASIDDSPPLRCQLCLWEFALRSSTVVSLDDVSRFGRSRGSQCVSDDKSL
jgi:hypothetical protein